MHFLGGLMQRPIAAFVEIRGRTVRASTNDQELSALAWLGGREVGGLLRAVRQDGNAWVIEAE